MESSLSEVQIYEERQPNGQWLKSIKFRLPIIAEDMSLSLNNDAHIKAMVLLSRINTATSRELNENTKKVHKLIPLVAGGKPARNLVCL